LRLRIAAGSPRKPPPPPSDAPRRFFDHSHSASAVRKMKKLAIGKLPDGVGERKGGSTSAPAADSSGSSIAPVIGVVLLLVALVVYAMMSS